MRVSLSLSCIKKLDQTESDPHHSENEDHSESDPHHFIQYDYEEQKESKSELRKHSSKCFVVALSGKREGTDAEYVE